MTSYDVVYKRFLNKITDFNFAELDDFNSSEMLKDWLGSAIVNVRTSTNVYDRDDELEQFNNDLSYVDIELLAKGMVLAWLEQYLNSTELVSQFIGGKEEKVFSQSKHLAELRELRRQIEEEMHRLHTYHTYSDNEYFK